jgi:hypothetical protein
LEVEANLVGQNGELMAELQTESITRQLVTIFDAANISTRATAPVRLWSNGENEEGARLDAHQGLPSSAADAADDARR